MYNPNEIGDYLLGRLTEEQMKKIEQRIFSDDDFCQEVEIAETELLDRYAQGQLTGEERNLFERHFLVSPLRQERLRFALALEKKTRSAASPLPVPVLPLWRRFLPHALAACLSGAAVLGGLTYRLSRGLEEQHEQNAALSRQLEELRKSAASTPSLDLTTQLVFPAELLPESSRSGTLKRISPPPGTHAVQLVLQTTEALNGDVTAELLDDSGRTLAMLKHSRPQKLGNKSVVIAVLPSEFLKEGNYFLRLKNVQLPSVQLEYPFQVSF